MEDVDLKKLDITALVDMLAKHTAEYMRILRDGSTTAAFEHCKDMINKLTAEINFRKQTEP